MKKIAIALITAFIATSATAASIVETGDVKEYYIDFDSASEVTLTVSSEVYTAGRQRTLISIRKIDDSLFIVEQENLYYTMELVYPPLPLIERQDVASQLISDSGFVRVLVPAHLTVNVEAFERGYTCMAHWSGFELNATTGACEQVGTSGCSNPFEHTDLAACEIAHGLR